MKPAPFDYRRPGTLADAIAALAGEPDAKVLAGGQSLVPLLSMRLAAPATARRHQRDPRPGHHRGHRGPGRRRPGGRARPARRRPRLGRRTPRAATRAARAGARRPPDDPQPRHHGRLPRARRRRGGDAGRADRCSAAPSRSRGPSGRRTIPADELYVGPLESSVRHDEIAVSAFFPALASGRGRRVRRRSPAGTATTPWSGPRPSSTATRSGWATSRSATSRRSSTSPASPTTSWATRR